MPLWLNIVILLKELKTFSHSSFLLYVLLFYDPARVFLLDFYCFNNVFLSDFNGFKKGSLHILWINDKNLKTWIWELQAQAYV